MSGGGEISAEEKIKIDQLRQNVQDVLQPHHDDLYLVKWIRARWGDIKKAETMLRKSLEWRKQVGADAILESWKPPEVLSSYFPGGLFGSGKDGSPLWIDTFGLTDMKGIFHSCKRTDLIKYKIYHCEEIQRALREKEKENGKTFKFVMIYDLDGFGWKHLWKPGMDVYTEVLAIFEANYPESMGTTYIINAPKIFPLAYNIFKPFLSEDTTKKVRLLGSNWKRQLLEYFDADRLPKHWGGNLVGEDGDEYCRSLGVVVSGEVPKSYYLNGALDTDTGNIHNLSVGRGSTEQVEQVITKPRDVLRWQFTSKGYDITFGLYRKTADEKQKPCDMEELIAPQRVNSHMVPENGLYTCDKAGIYVLLFDNTGSWIYGKKVSYSLDVLNCEKDPTVVSEEVDNKNEILCQRAY